MSSVERYSPSTLVLIITFNLVDFFGLVGFLAFIGGVVFMNFISDSVMLIP